MQEKNGRNVQINLKTQVLKLAFSQVFINHRCFIKTTEEAFVKTQRLRNRHEHFRTSIKKVNF